MKTETLNLANFIIACSALLIAGVGIVISILSNRNSKQANEIAMKATEFANRPYLVATITQDKNTKKYFEILKKENGIAWKFSIRIQNKGTTPANNISIPSMLNFKDIATHNSNHFIDLNSIVLGPGEKYEYDFEMRGEAAPGENLDELYKKFSKRAAPLVFKFVVSYKSLIDSESEYKTRISFQIKKDMVEILEGEYK